MKDQRQVSQHVHHLRKRGGGIDDFSLVVGVENQRARVKQTVAQPRTVTHQMANGDRPDRRLGWSNDVASGRSTRRFASCGINCSIGSSSWKWPSSNRRSAAQDVISFVFEKTRNMWSSRNGIGASLSAHPRHFTSTKSLPTSTAEENPERRFPSTYRCMAACAGRKSYPVAVTFMSSMIDPSCT